MARFCLGSFVRSQRNATDFSKPALTLGRVSLIGLGLDEQKYHLRMGCAHFLLERDHLILDLRCPQVVHEFQA